MFLYNIALSNPTAIKVAIVGNFLGQKSQEIIVAKGSLLELLQIDTETGKVSVLLTWDTFAAVRQIIPFRLTGGSKDYVIVTSDSGKIVILEYLPAKNRFKSVHEETFGKTGTRRIVPGQYLAVDPKGRAAMIGAVEKQKFVYVLNRDSAANLTISSPLDAHKSHTIHFDLCGVDVGFENPIFAALEVDYSEADQDPTGEALETTQKMLTFYELDLGLNHVARKWTEPVDPRSNMLIQVPGGSDGPGGVLVCSENFITWRNQDLPEVRVHIPRRKHALEDLSKEFIVVSSAVHKSKNLFFFLVQTEQGDLFKLTLDYSGAVVKDIIIKYFDTVPVASSLLVMKAGFLFGASEFGNHFLYQIHSLGDEGQEYTAKQWAKTESVPLFEPRELTHLAVVDELQSLAPLMDCKIADLTNDDTPQFYSICGRGPKSTLRILRHGLEITEMATSQLPANPIAIWTVKKNVREAYDSYIVVSFINATLVLSIGETVEEVTDSGFLAPTPTLHVSQIGDEGILQIHPGGVRHIRADRRVNEWRAPSGRTIVKATANERQVVIALTGGEIVYFALDDSGQLNEFQDRKEMTSEVTSLALGPIPAGRLRSKFLAVAGFDSTVRMVSLDPDEGLQTLSTQALPAPAESLCMVEMTEEGTDLSTLYLSIGLVNGVLLRSVVDHNSGALSDTRTRFLGAKPVKLFRLTVQRSQAVLALSTKPWLSYTFQGRSRLAPLSYGSLEYGSNFVSAQCPEGIVAISGNLLKVLTVEKLGNTFNQTSIPLRHTPRRFVIHPASKVIVTIETDHQVLSSAEKAKMLKEKEGDDGMDLDSAPPEENPLFEPTAPAGKWASCVRVLEPFQGAQLSHIEFDGNEGATCMAMCIFHDHADESFVVVGTGKDMMLAPRASTSGFLYVYRFNNGGKGVELLHKTPIEDTPTALCSFQGRLLVGMGKTLRIYDLGKRKLLRKCENKNFPNLIVSLHTQGDRIVVADVQESFHFVKYKYQDNQLIPFADDTLPRWVTSSCMLDYNTVAGGDKFGNFFVDRLPPEVSDEVDDDPSANRVMFERGHLNGATHKLNHLVEFFVGEILTSVNRAVLVPGGTEVIVYSTLSGGIGAFLPFRSPDELDFFQHLEMHMRNHSPSLCGRDHISYRSYYQTVKGVVDGGLCEQYNSLSYEKRKAIADELERTVPEISKKLEDIRNRVAF